MSEQRLLDALEDLAAGVENLAAEGEKIRLALEHMAGVVVEEGPGGDLYIEQGGRNPYWRPRRSVPPRG